MPILPNEPLDDCLKGDNPPDCDALLFCGGVEEEVRPRGPDWPGIRITRPQRVQGLLFASHSLPQRGHIMIDPSKFLAQQYLK